MSNMLANSLAYVLFLREKSLSNHIQLVTGCVWNLPLVPYSLLTMPWLGSSALTNKRNCSFGQSAITLSNASKLSIINTYLIWRQRRLSNFIFFYSLITTKYSLVVCLLMCNYVLNILHMQPQRMMGNIAWLGSVALHRVQFRHKVRYFSCCWDIYCMCVLLLCWCRCVLSD